MCVCVCAEHFRQPKMVYWNIAIVWVIGISESLFNYWRGWGGKRYVYVSAASAAAPAATAAFSSSNNMLDVHLLLQGPFEVSCQMMIHTHI